MKLIDTHHGLDPSHRGINGDDDQRDDAKREAMKKVLLVALFVFFGMSLTGRAQPNLYAQGELAELVVPLDTPSDFLTRAEKSLQDSLAGIGAKSRDSPQSLVSKAGQFVLWGDLFKLGGCFVLAELPPDPEAAFDSPNVAFAEWTSGKWKLRGLWKIGTVWRPKTWKASDSDYLPATPATQPFEMRDLSGDGTPEVVIAGEVAKYYQQNYLLRFSPKTHTLKLVASAMGEPEVAGKLVRLYFNSGRRAIYEEWQFFRWKGDNLIPIASWHDEVGYGTNDPTFSEGGRTDRRGISDLIRVVYGRGQEIDVTAYELTRKGKPFGHMQIKWMDENNISSINSDDIEKAWLFEKITGLPRRLYPAREGTEPILRLENFAAVTVEENAEAAKLFSFSMK